VDACAKGGAPSLLLPLESQTDCLEGDSLGDAGAQGGRHKWARQQGGKDKGGRHSRITRTSWQKYLPPNCRVQRAQTPAISVSGLISLFVRVCWCVCVGACDTVSLTCIFVGACVYGRVRETVSHSKRTERAPRTQRVTVCTTRHSDGRVTVEWRCSGGSRAHHCYCSSRAHLSSSRAHWRPRRGTGDSQASQAMQDCR